MEVGAVLKDGSTYKPVRQDFSVKKPGDTTVAIIVARPAFLTATFIEEGKKHRGSFVTAYQQGKEVFGFHAYHDILARPGKYEFRAEPNADNKLSLAKTLVEGKQTELIFDLTKTIQFYVVYVLPNGDKIRRGSELWRQGGKVYSVFSGNPTRVRPGHYELRSHHQNVPLTPVEIDIRINGETIEVPLDAGFVNITYAPSPHDYVRKPNAAFLESLDRGGSSYARLDQPIPVAPGRYKVNPQTSRGFFDPLDIDVRSNETIDAVFTPKPLGELVVNYAPSDNYLKNPDRAFVYPLEGQKSTQWVHGARETQKVFTWSISC